MTPHLQTPHRAKGFTLVEVVITAGILALVLLGVASSFQGLTRQQYMTKEQQAVQLACQSMFDEIDAYAQQNPGTFPTLITLYNGTGFHVYNSSSSANADADDLGTMGRGVDVTVASAAIDGSTFATSDVVGHFLNPGAASWFPDSRTAAPASVKQMAGYVEVTAVPARTDLAQVNIVVAWETYGGTVRSTFAMIVGGTQ